MMDNEKKIIQFKPRSPEDEARLPVIRKPRNRDGCKHEYGEVDEGLWRLFCQECKEELDPIKFLLDVIQFYEGLNWKYRQIQEFEERERIRSQKARERRSRYEKRA